MNPRDYFKNLYFKLFGDKVFEKPKPKNREERRDARRDALGNYKKWRRSQWRKAGEPRKPIPLYTSGPPDFKFEGYEKTQILPIGWKNKRNKAKRQRKLAA